MEIVNGDGAENGGTAHGLAIEEYRLARPALVGEVHCLGDVLGFEVADGGLVAS